MNNQSETEDVPTPPFGTAAYFDSVDEEHWDVLLDAVSYQLELPVHTSKPFLVLMSWRSLYVQLSRVAHALEIDEEDLIARLPAKTVITDIHKETGWISYDTPAGPFLPIETALELLPSSPPDTALDAVELANFAEEFRKRSAACSEKLAASGS